MNIMEQLKGNPTLLYGIAGVFAGNLLGGTKKSRTSQAVVYGALGAAIGWFVNKGNQQQRQAEISKVIAIESAPNRSQGSRRRRRRNGWIRRRVLWQSWTPSQGYPRLPPRPPDALSKPAGTVAAATATAGLQ